MMKYKTWILFILLLLSSKAICQISVQTDNVLKTRLDSIVHQAASGFMETPFTRDLSIGIYSKGHPYPYNYHTGAGHLSTGNDYYGLGSVAKTFAGLMLARAVVEGKLKLNDDIRKYLPGSYPNLEYKGHPIRIVDLSNHTSAMPAMSKEYSDQSMQRISKLSRKNLTAFFKEYTADSLFADMHHFKLDTIPGTKYHYNGNAVMVLIGILQRIYHQPYSKLITRYLHQQYGMDHTKPFLTKTDEKKLLMGYDDTGKEAPLIVDEGFRAAPSMVSTLYDMLKYIGANLDQNNPVIKLSHQPTFTTSDGTKMGLNWMMGKEENDVPFIMHTGRDGAGFTSLCYIYPGKQTGIVILVNNGIGEDKISTLKNEIITKLFRDKSNK
ncbi:serine hydrolase domain-containing protein [Chryseobacterium sp. PMSZPI]|uniref:serine hydrolase domain-containing protein n=1 Tax=Chryseobacterium sp. PMSZPI TaxID=1033900 RepID=UPI0039A1DC9F